FVDAMGALAPYSVKAGYQVPGSDFSARDNSFWATTSDAMATEGSATVALVTNYKFTSSANLVEDGSSIALYTKEVVCAWGIGSAVISGGWKMATGAYFAGTFSGADAKNIYDVDYSGGTPSTGISDISKLMTFGKSFAARPDSFAVTYSYAHVANSSSDYPQKDLIYVMLVSADNKVVATGAVIDDASVETTTKRVALSYGADPNGLLTGGYPVASGLTLGSGTEEVASIHIMFASSAYAYVVAGGAAGSSGKYRGGENSELVLDQFKLVY
ncbi:MAG: PCMD domain-containing protein, partial [Fibrobacteraceae bacterium]